MRKKLDLISEFPGLESNPKPKFEFKSQVFAFDLIVALVIFLSIIGVYGVWKTQLTQKNVQSEDFQQASLKASQAAFLLLETPGVPEDWNSSTVKQAGLATERGVVNARRLASFLNLTYANATKLLGVGAYDFYFELRFVNGTIASANQSGVFANATMGNFYDNYSLQIPVRRLVRYNGDNAVMLVRLAR